MTSTQPRLRIEQRDDVTLNRHDLQALVDVLAHDAFAIDERGIAARRALQQISRVLETGVTVVRIGSE